MSWLYRLRQQHVSLLAALGEHGSHLVGEARHAGVSEIVEKVVWGLGWQALLAREPDDRVGDLAGELVGQPTEVGVWIGDTDAAPAARWRGACGILACDASGRSGMVAAAVDVIATLGGAVISAVVAFAVARYTTHREIDRLRHQDRSAAYRQVMDWVEWVRRFAELARADFDEASDPRLPPAASAEDDLQRASIVEAYASEDVRRAYGHLRGTLPHLRAAVSDFTAAKHTQPTDEDTRSWRTRALEDFRSARDATFAACDELRDAIRSDLGS